jgi:hypothetical protein
VSVCYARRKLQAILTHGSHVCDTLAQTKLAMPMDGGGQWCEWDEDIDFHDKVIRNANVMPEIVLTAQHILLHIHGIQSAYLSRHQQNRGRSRVDLPGAGGGQGAAAKVT